MFTKFFLIICNKWCITQKIKKCRFSVFLKNFLEKILSDLRELF